MKNDLVTYNKTFNELLADLNQPGTPSEILKKVINALYIIGLDKEQFKDILTPIYGKEDWVERDVLSKELSLYCTQCSVTKFNR